MIILTVLYAIVAVLLALYGIQAGVLSILYLIHRRETYPLPSISEWPHVTIQLPLYNELYVAERLLKAVSRLNYPRQRMQIQVLDDSTDETREIVEKAVVRYQRAGFHIELIRRSQRQGFKAGALEAGLKRAIGEFIAIFDADFVPPTDFLQRTIPYFVADPALGMVQTRWGHINPFSSSLTRAQAIALDGHFIVEQAGRHRAGFLFSFNGTAGVWRRSCIEDSGGWSADTLCEDLDLSYRAQLAGWRCLYLPEVESPAEIPAQMAALKRQQARWAQGTIQCLLKLWRPVLTSSRPLTVRLMGLLHLGAYLAHPMTLALLLLMVPLMLVKGGLNLPLAGLSLASLGSPLMMVIGQRTLYRDWRRRLRYLPVLMLIGTGLAWRNTLAILRAILHRQVDFQRTPKFRLTPKDRTLQGKHYVLGFERENWGELILLAYAGLALGLAVTHGHWGLVPFLGLYVFGFAYVSLYDVWQRFREMASASHDSQRMSEPIVISSHRHFPHHGSLASHR